MLKRMFDVACAAVGLLICGPFFVLVSILIKIDSTGPVFFRQVRMGRGFQRFSIWKFRTMVQDAPDKGGTITIGQDLRMTRLGRVLRAYKIDELPQLINVLRGEMSLVGPRPEVPIYVELFKKEYEEILTVRPGLTDLGSLKFIHESDLLEDAADPEEEYRRRFLPEKIRLAKIYIEHASFLFDLAVIAQTLLYLIGVRLAVCELPEPQQSAKQAGQRYGDKVKSLILRWRRPLVVILDLSLIMLANYLAFWLRFDGDIPVEEEGLFLRMLPWLVVIRGVAFSAFRLNEGLWRYTSIWDFKCIVSGVFTSSVAFYCLVDFGFGLTEYPRAIFIIDSLLLVGFLVGVRLPSRLFREQVVGKRKRKVLIYGAGDLGESLVREMKSTPAIRYEPIGFIDDDSSLFGQRIHGIQVLGTRQHLARIIPAAKPDEIILALPNGKPGHLREIVASLEPFQLSIRTVPRLRDMLEGKSTISQVRNLALEDLLPRAPVGSHSEAVSHMIRGRRVLITGAGGSIGSELSRQIAELRPDAIILYERHENSLYTIARELEDRGYSSITHPIIGDVTDDSRLHAIMKEYRPDIMFHAAAHKHVPLMELNAAEALKNNCIGTRIAAESADKFGVERFVLISTDKAVNPSNVMGATKRVAELVVQGIARGSRTCFLTVRFGNVLGSNGSVVLRFQEQIAAGGPVTVTHPDVRRYFMLISEAVHLVLQATTLGEQGAIYILDMGEQIKVLDLARNLIRLSGFLPGKEIPISFIGLRPGEKLSEELIGKGETAEPSPLEKILRIRTTTANGISFGILEKLSDDEISAILDKKTDEIYTAPL
jgi:FlaA1/EpsC-like NDP-sugar epimerase/lipopolysaccharide/colanic/teichoic acid biosynthesis glycosyltransferase